MIWFTLYLWETASWERLSFKSYFENCIQVSLKEMSMEDWRLLGRFVPWQSMVNHSKWQITGSWIPRAPIKGFWWHLHVGSLIVGFVKYPRLIVTFSRFLESTGYLEDVFSFFAKPSHGIFSFSNNNYKKIAEDMFWAQKNLSQEDKDKIVNEISLLIQNIIVIHDEAFSRFSVISLCNSFTF